MVGSLSTDQDDERVGLVNSLRDLVDAADDFSYSEFLTKMEQILDFYEPQPEVRIRE